MMVHRESRPVRGCLFGILLSLPFWAVVAVVVFIIIRR